MKKLLKGMSKFVIVAVLSAAIGFIFVTFGKMFQWAIVGGIIFYLYYREKLVKMADKFILMIQKSIGGGGTQPPDPNGQASKSIGGGGTQPPNPGRSIGGGGTQPPDPNG